MKMSRYLREGDIEILHTKKCPAATNMHKLYNFESMMCAFNPKHVDTCQVGWLALTSFLLILFENYFQGDSGGVSYTKI